MQTAIVCLAVAAAVAYAAWRLWDALRDGGDPCRGCQLAQACKWRKDKGGCE